MKIVFRCDASREVGSGHVYRCMALAHALAGRGGACVFAVNAQALEIVPQLAEDFQVYDADYAAPCDILVVDHYGLGAAYESGARAWASRIVVLDDLADRAHDCDVLLDQTYGRDAADYQGLVPEGCAILAGAQYSLLRPEFAAYRGKALSRRAAGGASGREKIRVLVSLGSTNYRNATGHVLDGLRFVDVPLSIDVVVGQGASHYDDVVAQAKDLDEKSIHDVRFLTHVADMAALMTEADLAIGAGGTTSWERCALGLPTVLLVLADNQNKIAAELSAAGVVLSVGHIDDFDPQGFGARLAGLLNDKDALATMSERAAAICDGRGIRRVLPWLYADERSRDGAPVRLRLMEHFDEDVLLAIQSRPETRRYANNPAAPDAQTHHDWMLRKLADGLSYPYMILCGDDVAGHIRLDPDEGGSYIVSVLVDPDFYRQGVGRAALAFLHRLHSGAKIVAQILPGNEGSLTLFERAGYVPAGKENWYRYG